MAGPRDLRVNFERMWREMDELLGSPLSEQWGIGQDEFAPWFIGAVM